MQGTQVFLIRHGDTGESLQGRFIGREDAPLSPLGRRQAAALTRRPDLARCRQAVRSPMRRVRETFEIAELDLVCRQDEDLREIDFGLWEALSFAEIARDYPDDVEGWARLDPDFRFPQGESLAHFRERIEKAAERIARTAATGTDPLAVFAHGGVIRALICHWLGLPARHYLLFDIDPASVSAVRLFGERGVLAGLNDRSHLEGSIP
jgi:broad specificity phosphatase PhoE